MWDDIIIGKGRKGLMATNITENISENDVSYWVLTTYFGMGMIIYKDTEEGKKLAELIAQGKDTNEFLDELAFRKGDIQTLMKRIREKCEKAFREGRASKEEEIKKALGI